MGLKDNPFYLLNVSCTAGRREIVSASDEMSFLLDQDICQKAQAELLTPAKRLSAEIDWFVDADEGIIQNIRSCIQNNKPISADGLLSLSKLNARLHNFSLSSDTSFFELGNSIQGIDKAYSALNTEEITEIINKNRSVANINQAQSRDVQTELLKRKREEIRQIISEKLSGVNQETYVELITLLTEKQIANNSDLDSPVLLDVIDQYEVRMQAVLEKNTEKIEKHIERIKRNANTTNTSEEIDLLIDEVKRWDILAQPLQLKSQASGMPHAISERLGSEIRNLTLFLNNERGLTKDALTLVNAMKSVFAELGNLLSQLQNDSNALRDLLKEQNAADSILAELKSLEKEAEGIKAKPELHSVNAFVNHVKMLDQHLKTVNLDKDTRAKVRENLCLMARATAIDLHNTKHESLYALTIAKALVEEFSDLPSISAKLNDDVVVLKRQLSLPGAKQPGLVYPSVQTPTVPSNNRSSSSSSSSNKGCLIGLLVIIGICVIIGIGSRSVLPNRSSSSYGRGSSTTSTAKPTAKETTRPTTKPVPKSEKVYSSASAIGDSVYVDILLIEPEYGVYTTQKNRPVTALTTYHDYVCKCTTDSGTIVWVNFNARDYGNEISSSIERYVNSSSSGFNGEKVRYSPAARLHGKVVRASSVMSGLDVTIEQTSLIEYSSIDIPEQKIHETTTIYIKSIFPSYTITSGNSDQVTHVLCECSNSNNTKYWIYMTVDEYKKHFDSTANPGKDSFAKRKEFSFPEAVTVTTAYADDLIDEVSNTIGQETIFVFSEPSNTSKKSPQTRATIKPTVKPTQAMKSPIPIKQADLTTKKDLARFLCDCPS